MVRSDLTSPDQPKTGTAATGVAVSGGFGKKTCEGQSIAVTFEAGRCQHAAECVRGLPEVFDIERRPWIQPDNAAADRTAEVVRRCPSGALEYRRVD